MGTSNDCDDTQSVPALGKILGVSSRAKSRARTILHIKRGGGGGICMCHIATWKKRHGIGAHIETAAG